MLTTILYVILALLILTSLYVLVRTIVFQWSVGTVARVEGIAVDEQKIAEHLTEAVRCKTMPLDKTGTPDPEAFAQLHQMMEQTYRLVHRKLIYTWQGTRQELEPVMVIALQDVVSADPTEWTHPPFEGVITDGLIWGRGTLDIKNQLIGIMEAAESLQQQGYRPKRRHLLTSACCPVTRLRMYCGISRKQSMMIG